MWLTMGRVSTTGRGHPILFEENLLSGNYNVAEYHYLVGYHFCVSWYKTFTSFVDSVFIYNTLFYVQF